MFSKKNLLDELRETPNGTLDFYINETKALQIVWTALNVYILKCILGYFIEFQ